MKIYDISVTIQNGMVVWPGQPPMHLERVSKIEEGANHNGTQMGPFNVHVGTHVDSPFHFVEGGSTVESLPLDVLTGRAQVVELPGVDLITAEALVNAGVQKGMDRVLLKTRNSSYWANHLTEFQTNFVGVSPDGAEYLVWQGVKLVGVDYLSVAPYKKSKETHQILLQHNVVVVEGLDLSQVPTGTYHLCCLPLKLAGSDGAPARAILVEE